MWDLIFLPYVHAVDLQWLKKTDGSFTTAVSKSFLSPLEKNLIAADLE